MLLNQQASCTRGGRKRMFQVVFGFSSYTKPEFSDLQVEDVDLQRHTSLFDYELTVMQQGRILSLIVEYSTDLFEAETILDTLKQLSVLLSVAAKRRDSR